MSIKKLLWVLFYGLLFSILLHNSFSYLDPDFGWHLKFGEIIWYTADVPRDQIFMWTLAGKTWVDHEWLANLGIYGLWSIGGYIFVSLCFALIPVITIWLINRHIFSHFIKNKEGQIIIACIEMVALYGMAPHLGIRVQELTLLALTILLILFSRVSIQKNLTPPWWLPLLFYVWACVHAGFLLGLGLLTFWLGFQIVIFYFPRLRGKYLIPLARPFLYQWVLLGGLSFLLTLITPYGLSLYSFLSEYRDTFYQSHIQEWLSPFTFPIHYTQIILNLFVISSSLTVYKVLYKKDIILNYIIIALLSIMSFKSVRHFPLLMGGWLILILPHLIPELTKKISLGKTHLLSALTGIALFGVTIFILLFTRFTTAPFSSYCVNYACGAVKFLKDHPEYHNRLFNSYNVGGYMIGVAPEIPLFIDGRLPQYPYKGHSALGEYLEFSKPSGVRKKLNEHNIQTVIYQKYPPTPKPNWFEKYFLGYGWPENQINPFLAYISSSANWTRVYEDETGLVYIKKE